MPCDHRADGENIEKSSAATVSPCLWVGRGVPTQVPSEVPVELASQEPLSTERPADGSPSDASPREAITEGGKEVSPDTPTQKPVQWSSCSLLTGKEGKEAECATIPLPLDWSDPQGKTIDVFIKRIRATSSQGQLWLLHGGPASSGQGVEAIVKPLLDTGKLPLDIYIIDHRGTGRSTRIGCPTQEAKDSPGGYSVTPDELKGCLAAIEKEWGKGFQQFTTTNAARDLYALINRTKGPNEPFFLFGVSYGTFWAHRFLQLYPKAPKGVVLDSLCMPGHCHQTRADDYSEETAIKLMSLCAKDPFCNQKLGPDPWKRTKEIFQKFEQGHCQLLQKSGFTRYERGGHLQNLQRP